MQQKLDEELIIYNSKEVEYLRSQKGGKYKPCFAYCEQCEQKYTTTINRLYLTGFLCRKCKISNTKKNTSKEFKRAIQEKRKKTCLEKYGVDNVFKSDEFKEKKIKATSKIKEEHFFQEKDDVLDVPKIDEEKHLDYLKGLKLTKWELRSKEESQNIVDKREQTFLKKYGTKCAAQVDEFKQKMQQTCLEKYGVANPLSSEKVKEKIKQTNNKRYGGNSPLCNPTVQEKRLKTFEKNKKNRSKINRYFFDSVCFDSSWELAVWIYCKDKNITIEREPTMLEYLARNKVRHYIPDFCIDGCLVEIKGNQFFDKNGNLINHFNREYDDIAKEKQKCMASNNVQIWKFEEIKHILIYIKNKYGKNYLKNFKTKVTKHPLQFPNSHKEFEKTSYLHQNQF